MKERYWQNWDEADIASQIDMYWRSNATEQEWYDCLILDLAANFKKESAIFEIGCGSGLVYQKLLEKKIVTPRSYSGADVSEKMLEIARANYPDARFSKMDIFNLPLEDHSQPNVICVHVIQHLPHYQDVLDELVRVCRDRLYLVSWFTCDTDDSIDFSKFFLGDTSFHNNQYSLQKFLYFIYSRYRTRIKNLTCTQLVGASYSLTISFNPAESASTGELQREPVIYISPRMYEEEVLNWKSRLNAQREEYERRLDLYGTSMRSLLKDYVRMSYERSRLIAGRLYHMLAGYFDYAGSLNVACRPVLEASVIQSASSLRDYILGLSAFIRTGEVFSYPAYSSQERLKAIKIICSVFGAALEGPIPLRVDILSEDGKILRSVPAQPGMINDGRPSVIEFEPITGSAGKCLKVCLNGLPGVEEYGLRIFEWQKYSRLLNTLRQRRILAELIYG